MVVQREGCSIFTFSSLHCPAELICLSQGKTCLIVKSLQRQQSPTLFAGGQGVGQIFSLEFGGHSKPHME